MAQDFIDLLKSPIGVASVAIAYLTVLFVKHRHVSERAIIAVTRLQAASSDRLDIRLENVGRRAAVDLVLRRASGG